VHKVDTKIMKTTRRFRTLALTILLATGAARAAQVEVTIHSLAPAGGTYMTPAWVGFHDGTFDLFDAGSAASAALERLAEDGNPSVVASDFTASGKGFAQGVILSAGAGSPRYAPGDSGSMVFTVNPFDPKSRYLSFAAMVIPSNDAFIGNDNPLMIPVFAADGSFIGGTYTILGSQVWDAGTEVNDELPANTAFFGQATPDTGLDQNGVVAIHPGYLAAGSGGILDSPSFANADFKANGYQIAEITISAVPEPQAYALCASLGLLGLAAWRHRRTR
jgi:hypothetical protein